jgi:uncharacterized membrane protein (UPF0136 family)
MISPLVAHIALGVYAVLLGVGGVMGFVKARSHASLVTGLLAAICAGLAMVVSAMGQTWGIPLGALLAMTLFVVFGYRYAIRNRKFMPSGMLAVVSLIVLGVMILAADWGQ